MPKDHDEPSANRESVIVLRPSEALMAAAGDWELMKRALEVWESGGPAEFMAEHGLTAVVAEGGPHEATADWTDLDFASPGLDQLEPAEYRLDRDGWGIGMTDKFRDSVRKADRKTLGQVLLAMTEISLKPMTQVGDTVRPLEHNAKGLWRHLIAGWRVVYHPDPQRKIVTLLSFEPGSSIWN
jgi:mRNA-degrading endonuclease RelE of RelBE toxin-antitoxin system